MKHLNLLFALFLVSHLVLMNTSCCEILDNCEDPKSENQLGDTLWVHAFSGVDSFFMGGISAIGLDGIIYYGKGGGTVYWTPARVVAINPDDGSEKWVSPSIDNNGIADLVVGDDGTVYVIGYYRLYSINPTNGQFNWVWEVPETLPLPEGGEVYSYGQIGSLALTADGDLVFGSIGSGVYSRATYCVSPSGVTKWYNRDANGWSIATGIVADANKIFYYSEIADGLHLVSLDDGSGLIAWQTKINSVSSSGNNIVIDADGFLICSFILNSGDPYKMHKIDPGTGSIVWSSTDDSDNTIKLIGKNGTIYQQNYGGIFKFNPSQGTKVLFGTDVNFSIAGTAINNNDQLLIIHNIDWNSNINIYDNSGVLNWSVPMVNLRNNPFSISDDQVIIAIQATGICAIQGDAALARKGWPKHKHDNRNTSNATKY